jgi:hypothetical protein
MISRDKANVDITWLRDDSLEDLDNLPAPEIIAREIVEDLTAALEVAVHGRRTRPNGLGNLGHRHLAQLVQPLSLTLPGRREAPAPSPHGPVRARRRDGTGCAR